MGVLVATNPLRAVVAVGRGPSDSRPVASAFRPSLACQLAQLRRTELQLMAVSPRPLVVVVLGVGARSGVTTLAALLARAMAALAPGRVAALDGDGTYQALRDRLGTDGSGDLRLMLATPDVWRTRRLTERFVASRGSVPLLAAGDADRGRPLRSHELRSALSLLRRRFPVLVADLPRQAEVDRFNLAAQAADHVVLVGRKSGPPLEQARQWLRRNRTGRAAQSLTVVVPPTSSMPSPSGIDVIFPADAALASPGIRRLAELQLSTLAAVEAITCRIAAGWRNEMRPPCVNVVDPLVVV